MRALSCFFRPVVSHFVLVFVLVLVFVFVFFLACVFVFSSLRSSGTGDSTDHVLHEVDQAVSFLTSRSGEEEEDDAHEEEEEEEDEEEPEEEEASSESPQKWRRTD